MTKVAKSVGKVAGSLLGPVLKKLRGLIQPLLKRVLSFAIGRLPAPLQPVARGLASRLMAKAESEDFDEAETSPANLTDLEMLAESFDAALAEAVAPGAGEMEEEAFVSDEHEGFDSRELEMLAEARGVLMDQLRDSSDSEELAPAIEQFVPEVYMLGRWRYADLVNRRDAQDVQLHLRTNTRLRGGWQVGGQVLFEEFGYDRDLYANYALFKPRAGGVDTLRYTGTPTLPNLDWVLSVSRARWVCA